jgi:hypothetical protein
MASKKVAVQQQQPSSCLPCSCFGRSSLPPILDGPQMLEEKKTPRPDPRWASFTCPIMEGGMQGMIVAFPASLPASHPPFLLPSLPPSLQTLSSPWTATPTSGRPSKNGSDEATAHLPSRAWRSNPSLSFPMLVFGS